MSDAGGDRDPGAAGPDDLAETLVMVRAMQGGDDGARDRLVERYLPRVARMVSIYLGRRLASFVDEEDVIQEAMLRALAGVEGFEARGPGSFEAFVARAVRNAIIDADRRRRRDKRGGGKVLRQADLPTRQASLSGLASDQPTPSKLLAAAELEERHERALLALGARYREVLGMRDVLGCSFAQIAESMQIEAVSTARSLYHRARHELARRLGEARD